MRKEALDKAGLEAARHVIITEFQLRDFGRADEEGNFVCTAEQINQLEECADKAALYAVSAYLLAAAPAWVTEEMVEAAAKWMARDHALSGGRSMAQTEEHVAKHWKRYSREAGDILAAVFLEAHPAIAKAELGK